MSFFNEIEHSAKTHVGIKRPHNQDAFVVQQAPDKDNWHTVGHLYLVADGMGGHAVGEKASAKAVQEIPLKFVKCIATDGPANALRKAFQEANAGIHAIGESNPEFRGMGTTATALVLRGEGAWVAHVGDSRAYRIRDGSIQQLTYDHSYSWELARRLGIPPEEMEDVKKNVIVRSLGPDALVQVDIEGPYPLQSGDAFLLCSDGLSNLVTPDEIGAIVSSMPLPEATEFLIELANLRGGPDNITAIAVRIGQTTESMAIDPADKQFLQKIQKSFLGKIPWPMWLLLLGILLALGFVVASMAAWKGGVLLFACSLLSMVAGMIGLIMQTRKRPEQSDSESTPATKANIHRQYPIRIDQSLVDRWKNLTLQIKEQLEAREWKTEWTQYKKHVDEATRCMIDSDYLVAFRSFSRALHVLSRSFNKNRPKEESFKPKWDNNSGG